MASFNGFDTPVTCMDFNPGENTVIATSIDYTYHLITIKSHFIYYIAALGIFLAYLLY